MELKWHSKDTSRLHAHVILLQKKLRGTFDDIALTAFVFSECATKKVGVWNKKQWYFARSGTLTCFCCWSSELCLKRLSTIYFLSLLSAMGSQLKIMASFGEPGMALAEQATYSFSYTFSVENLRMHASDLIVLSTFVLGVFEAEELGVLSDKVKAFTK